jgi:hypothetical protein
VTDLALNIIAVVFCGLCGLLTVAALWLVLL